MKARLILLNAIMFLALFVTLVFGQIPTLTIYFDAQLTQGHQPCPNPPDSLVEDSLYVVAENFNTWFSAMEYQIQFPPQMEFIEDVTGGLDIGTSATGIATAWPVYMIGPERPVINKVKFRWNCQATPIGEIPVPIVPHPLTGHIRGVNWWNNDFIYAVGTSGWISQEEVPVEETTWGRIKSLYNN
jgi:hypothetical protein